tara:strand:+ start:1065 stop:1295 length:231 start_codon:yes stop_codon:yes gene_type:complete
MNDYFDERVERVTNLGCERQRKLEMNSKGKKKSKMKIKSKINYNGKEHPKSGFDKCLREHKPINSPTTSGKSDLFQ